MWLGGARPRRSPSVALVRPGAPRGARGAPTAAVEALQKEKEKEELRKQQEEEAEKERTEYGYVEFHHYPLVGIHYRT